LGTEWGVWESYGPLFSFEERYVFPEDSAEMEFYRYVHGKHPGIALELGAGDGRLTVATANGEYLAIGLEPSAAMLDCWRGSGTNPCRVRGSAQFIPLRRKSVRLVTFPYNGLHCILDRNHRKTVFEEVERVLAPGGVFVAETCPFFRDRPDEEPVLRYEYGGKDVLLRLVESVTHLKDRDGEERIVFDMVYTGKLVPDGRKEIRLVLALISAGELLTDLKAAGLDILSVWGDYDFSPWCGDASPRLLVMAGRRNR